MNIGIIGAGSIGGTFARALSRANIMAVISNSRGPESLAGAAQRFGSTITAVSVEEAAKQDIVLVAVPWSKIPSALSGLPDFGGRIVIDANNPFEGPGSKQIELNGRLSSEIFSDLVSGAKIVKAFNHLLPHLLGGDPKSEGGKRVLFYSGDDIQSKLKVSALIVKLGFFGIDLGELAVGGKLVQFPGGPLPVLNLVKFD